MELTMMLVEVPIKVHTPPNWLANERGINTRDAGMSRSLARAMETGMKMATVAVLITRADKPAIVTHSTNRRRDGDLPASLPRWRTSHSTQPVRTRPLLNTNMAATVAVALLAKPSIA